MTAAALTPSIEYLEDGVTLAFGAPFRFLSGSLEVTRILANGTVVVLTPGSAWSATGGSSDAGGTVTLVASIAGSRLKLRRVTPRAQQTDYTTNDSFPAESHEAALDKAMLIDQEQDVKILDTAARSLMWPEGELAIPLAAKATFVGKYFVGDANGDPVPSFGTGADVGLRSDLAAPTGAALVGLPGGGAVSTALPEQERYAEQGGTVAGEVDSKATLHAALIAMRALGGGRLKLLPGKTYNTSLSGATNMGGLVNSYPNLGNLLLPPVDNLHFDGNGGYLRSTAPSGALLVAMADYEREDIVTGAMAVGATTWAFLTAGVAANYAVGNNVLWRLEDNPIDTPEPLNWGHAKVLSVNTGANTVTLDRPLHRAWDGTDTNNKKLYRLATSHGQVIDNVRVAGLAVNGSTEVLGMLLHSLVAPRIPNTFIRDARIGVSVQMVEGADFGQVVLEHAPYTTSNTGQGIRCAESSVHIDSLYTRGVESEAVIAETASHVTIDYHEDVAINPKASRSIVQVSTNCEVHIRRALYKGKGGCIAFNSTDGGRVSWGHAHYEKDSHESAYPLPGRDCQELSLNIAGVKELYRAADKVNLTPLIEGGNTGAALEYFRPGLVSRLVVFFGGGLVAADITSLNLSYLDGTQQLIAIPPPAVSTQNAVDLTASLPRPGTGTAPNAFANRASYLNVSVNWASDLRGTGKFLLFDIDIIPDALDTSYLFGDVNSLRKAHGPNIRIGQKTYDAPSIAAGAQTSTTVTVTGAAVGDFVTAVALGVSPAGLTISGHVTAADTVTVWLDNNTAGAIDLASTTLSVKVEKR